MVDTMLSRRAFFGVTAGGALALYLPTAVGYRQAFAAPIPGGSLSPRKISKFRAPLVVPPAMPTIAPGEYEVAVRQIVQQILPPGLPATPVWGYGSAAHPSTFHYPAFTDRGQTRDADDGDLGQRPDRRCRPLPASSARR